LRAFLSFFLFSVAGVACRVWRFLPLLALLVMLGVVRRCLFFAWRYVALLGFLIANALSVHLLA
jgi:hypothetical protein